MITDRNSSKFFQISVILFEMKLFNFLHTPTYTNSLFFQTIDGCIGFGAYALNLCLGRYVGVFLLRVV